MLCKLQAGRPTRRAKNEHSKFTIAASTQLKGHGGTMNTIDIHGQFVLTLCTDLNPTWLYEREHNTPSVNVSG